MIDKDRIPPITKHIIDEYLSARMPKADYDYLVLLVTYGISKMLSYNRVFIENNIVCANKAIPNMFIMSFSPSGSGKDLGMRHLKQLMGPFLTDAKKEFANNYGSKIAVIDKYIESSDMKKGVATDYRSQNEPRYMKMEIDSNSTLEGFLSTREAFDKAGFGCTYWEDSEIYDTLQSGNPGAKEFIKYNKEAFDHGFSKGKIIKGNKKPVDIEKVPHLVCLHGAIDTDADINLFKPFFDLGFARRSFVYVSPPDKKNKRLTPVERRALAVKAESTFKDCKTLLLDTVNYYKRDSQIAITENGSCGYKKMTLAVDTEDLFFEYEEECIDIASKGGRSNNKGVLLETGGRPWRALKLAAIVCAQENGDVITKENLETAIYMTNYYGQHFKRFYTRQNESEEAQFVSLILENPGMSKTDMTRSGILKGSYSQRKHTVESLVKSGIPDYLAPLGKVLNAIKTGKTLNGTGYEIVDIPEHNNCEDDIVVHYSQGKSNERHETKMTSKEIEFNKIHEVVCAPYIYSSARFENEHRAGKNWQKNDDLIILDFDNEVPKDKQMTMELAKERFKDFLHVIIPTKSNGIEKKMNYKEGKPKEIRERFRLILPTNPMGEIAKERYKEVMNEIVKEFNLGFQVEKQCWVDVGAMQDPVKMYFGHEAKPDYNQGKLFNWKVFDFKKKASNRKTFKRDKKNVLDPSTILEIKGKPLSLSGYLSEAMMANGKTIACKAYCHDDNTPSAFIVINKSGNLQYHCATCDINTYHDLN